MVADIVLGRWEDFFDYTSVRNVIDHADIKVVVKCKAILLF